MAVNDLNKPSGERSGIANTNTAHDMRTIRAAVAYLRAELRDYAELNYLLGDKESSDVALGLAIVATINDINSTPPLIGDLRIVDIPPRLVMLGAKVEVLSSAGVLMTRNQLSFSDGQGVQGTTTDKAPSYMSWINTFKQDYERKKIEWKRAKNVQDALEYASGVGSEWELVHGFVDSFGVQ